MKYLLAFEEILVKIEKSAIVIFVFLMALLSFLQIGLRLFFHSGIVWLDTFLRYVVLWAGMLGASLSSRYSKHFAVDVFARMLPPRWSSAAAVFTGLFAVFVSILLFFASNRFLKQEFLYNSTAFYVNNTAVKSGWLELILPVSFLLIGFHLFVGIFRQK
ncbi:MAG: TRAP transporter small permease subunit [Elusimicrobia bacterium]|nr:TRAP transporter small permease subunit [Elusimicrobiota bacterium]